MKQKHLRDEFVGLGMVFPNENRHIGYIETLRLIRCALEEDHILCRQHGSRGSAIEVQKKYVKRDRSILKRDAKKHGYKIRFVEFNPVLSMIKDVWLRIRNRMLYNR